MSGPLKLLRTPAEYEAAIEEIGQLMGAAPGTPEDRKSVV